MLGRPHSPVGPILNLNLLDSRSPKGGGKGGGSSSSSSSSGSSSSGSSSSSSSSSTKSGSSSGSGSGSSTSSSSGGTTKVVPGPVVIVGTGGHGGYYHPYGPGYVGVLPIWALILIIVFGTMFLVFLIAIIAMCIANRKRAKAGKKKRSGGRICGIALLAATGLLFWVWLFRLCCCNGKNRKDNKTKSLSPERYDKLSGAADDDYSTPLNGTTTTTTTPVPAQTTAWNAPPPMYQHGAVPMPMPPHTDHKFEPMRYDNGAYAGGGSAAAYTTYPGTPSYVAPMQSPPPPVQGGAAASYYGGPAVMSPPQTPAPYVPLKH